MRVLQGARKVVVCGHRGPDGDAMGSALGWAEYLKGLGKSVAIIMPTPCPDFLQWLPDSSTVIYYDHKPKLAQSLFESADLVCCLDFNALPRLQDMAPAVERSKAPRLMIDHHLDPDPAMAGFVISHPEMSSTCEIVFRLLYQFGGYEAMTANGAAALYCGMMTDTGGFTYASSNPEIYLIISLLLQKGIDKDKIYRNVYNNYSPSRLKLQGYILYEKLAFFADNRASLFTLTREELKRFRFIRGDAEGLVNIPLQVKGMRLSISLREDTERDLIRVSLRSVDDFPCNKMAEEFFNGGGHLNASGGTLPFPMAEAVKTAERAIEAYKDLL
ncbi:MAG: bifunctional oligoribonuclease/PAP phosphatase NrnA [Alloprevotella sp.]|nr:bifunctional oligoribonuclease/PAP phosphatase NrnA [Alloprevotella sp.]